MLYPGLKQLFGVELDPVKCKKADTFLARVVAEMARHGYLPEGTKPPHVMCAAIEHVQNVQGVTHAYSFWEGIPREGREAFG